MMKTILLILLGGLFSSSACLAQNKPLEIFNQFTGKSWEGHYVDSEDSLLIHELKWEFILNSKGAKETKSVPEVGFEMETYFYYDWEKNQISFLSLINKEMNSNGKVVAEGPKIILEGKTFYSGGSSEFKKTFEVNEDGKLIDEFYRKKGDGWIRGHLIEYFQN